MLILQNYARREIYDYTMDALATTWMPSLPLITTTLMEMICSGIAGYMIYVSTTSTNN